VSQANGRTDVRTDSLPWQYRAQSVNLGHVKLNALNYLYSRCECLTRNRDTVSAQSNLIRTARPILTNENRRDKSCEFISVISAREQALTANR